MVFSFHFSSLYPAPYIDCMCVSLFRFHISILEQFLCCLKRPALPRHIKVWVSFELFALYMYISGWHDKKMTFLLTKHFFRNSRTELTPKHLMLFWFQENVRIRNLFEKRKMMCVEPADFQAWLIDWVSGFAEFDSMVYKKWIEDDIQRSFLQVIQNHFLKSRFAPLLLKTW